MTTLVDAVKFLKNKLAVICAVRTDIPPTYAEGDVRPLRLGPSGGLLTEGISGGAAGPVIITGAEQGLTSAAPVTATPIDDDHTALDVCEQQAPRAEDNEHALIGVAMKPVGALSVTDEDGTHTYCWSISKSTALAASLQIRTSAGNVRKVRGRIDSTAPSATYYVQIMNAVSLPADGAVTLLVAPEKVIHTTASDSKFEIDLLDNGAHVTLGAFLVLSSTEFTKTISGAFLSATAWHLAE